MFPIRVQFAGLIAASHDGCFELVGIEVFVMIVLGFFGYHDSIVRHPDEAVVATLHHP